MARGPGGEMLDLPHVKAAEALLARAARAKRPASPSAKAQPRARPHWGKYFEELQALEGQVVAHALTRTVTETDNARPCSRKPPEKIARDWRWARCVQDAE